MARAPCVLRGAEASRHTSAHFFALPFTQAAATVPKKTSHVVLTGSPLASLPGRCAHRRLQSHCIKRGHFLPLMLQSPLLLAALSGLCLPLTAQDKEVSITCPHLTSPYWLWSRGQPLITLFFCLWGRSQLPLVHLSVCGLWGLQAALGPSPSCLTQPHGSPGPDCSCLCPWFSHSGVEEWGCSRVQGRPHVDVKATTLQTLLEPGPFLVSRRRPGCGFPCPQPAPTGPRGLSGGCPCFSLFYLKPGGRHTMSIHYC